MKAASIRATPSAQRLPEPTEKQLEVVRFVAEYHLREKRAPALREVPADRAVLERCRRHGWIWWDVLPDPGRRSTNGRTLRVTTDGRALLQRKAVQS